MAVNSCIGEIAGNIAQNCVHPLVGGYTGRAILIPWSANPTFTQDAQNPRIVTAIALGDGVKVCAVDNVGPNFDGSTTASTGDSGFINFTKTFALRILERGGKMSKEVLEPLVKSAQGFVAILEKQDKVGDGSFEVVGLLSPLKATADGATRTESENGGAWGVTMTTTESWADVALLVDGGFAGTKAYFDNLYNTKSF